MALEDGKKRTIEGLNKRSGHDLDEEYADKIAVDAHEDAIDLFKDAADDAKDADIKVFAAKTLPTLQAHLEKGKALEKAVDHAGKNRPVAGAADTIGSALALRWCQCMPQKRFHPTTTKPM